MADRRRFITEADALDEIMRDDDSGDEFSDDDSVSDMSVGTQEDDQNIDDDHSGGVDDADGDMPADSVVSNNSDTGFHETHDDGFQVDDSNIEAPVVNGVQLGNGGQDVLEDPQPPGNNTHDDGFQVDDSNIEAPVVNGQQLGNGGQDVLEDPQPPGNNDHGGARGDARGDDGLAVPNDGEPAAAGRDAEHDPDENIDVDDPDDDNNDRDQNAAQRAPNPNDLLAGSYRIGELWMADFTSPCGPSRHDATSTAGEIFSDMLDGGNPGGDTDIVDTLVEETNRYAEQFRNDFPENASIKKWTPIDRPIMKAFLAVILYMGLVSLPSLQLFWSTHWLFNLPIADIISRNDFLLVLKFLHCANNAAAIARGLPGYDRLFKIRHITDQFIANWQACYYPAREISIDECIVAFKGRSYLKQYNPKKPHKWGLCVWSVAESTTGYSYGWQIFAGKGHHVQESGNGVTYDIVMNVMRDNGLLDKGHHIYMDNFFSSPILFQDLSNHWTGACGTLRVNRQLVPQTIKDAKPKKGDPPVFDKHGRLQYMVWQDKKKVSVVTSLHDDSTFTKRVKDKNAENHEREVVKPCAIELYTKYMRGVDLADQQMWHSLFDHKSLKWWKKILFALLETSFVNTVIIYKATHRRETINRNKLRLEIITSLLEGYVKKPNKRGRRHSDAPPARLTERHFSVPNPNEVAEGKPGRLECIVCTPPAGKKCRTTNWCRECRVPVHPYSCFERLHTLQDYKYRCQGPTKGMHE